MTVKIYVPRDSAALAVGAERVVKALQAEIAARHLDATIIRNGSRGLHWLEVLVEVETPRGRIATLAAYRHLGVMPPKAAGELFSE